MIFSATFFARFFGFLVTVQQRLPSKPEQGSFNYLIAVDTFFTDITTAQLMIQKNLPKTQMIILLFVVFLFVYRSADAVNHPGTCSFCGQRWRKNFVTLLKQKFKVSIFNAAGGYFLIVIVLIVFNSNYKGKHESNSNNNQEYSSSLLQEIKTLLLFILSWSKRLSAFAKGGSTHDI